MEHDYPQSNHKDDTPHANFSNRFNPHCILYLEDDRDMATNTYLVSFQKRGGLRIRRTSLPVSVSRVAIMKKVAVF